MQPNSAHSIPHARSKFPTRRQPQSRFHNSRSLLPAAQRHNSPAVNRSTAAFVLFQSKQNFISAPCPFLNPIPILKLPTAPAVESPSAETIQSTTSEAEYRSMDTMPIRDYRTARTAATEGTGVEEWHYFASCCLKDDEMRVACVILC